MVLYVDIEAGLHREEEEKKNRRREGARGRKPCGGAQKSRRSLLLLLPWAHTYIATPRVLYIHPDREERDSLGVQTRCPLYLCTCSHPHHSLYPCMASSVPHVYLMDIPARIDARGLGCIDRERLSLYWLASPAPHDSRVVSVCKLTYG